METDFKNFVLQAQLPAARIQTLNEEVRRIVMGASTHLTSPNFAGLDTSDLSRMFEAYDRLFFQGNCARQLGQRSLRFELSRKMTSAAGRTTHFRARARSPGLSLERFEIGVATTLLFQNFQPGQGPLRVTGLSCPDRLSALQRVMEHEIVHLVEMLAWQSSSCSGARFQGIALRFFGHTEKGHRLITPRERAYQDFGLKTGDRVRFRLDGEEHIGIINRITKRATVLVEHPNGQRYTNGKCYAKYYVPIALLHRATG